MVQEETVAQRRKAAMARQRLPGSDRSAGAERLLEAITLRNHTTSPFLTLPPELRNSIYTYVFSVGPIHVCRGPACSHCDPAEADSDVQRKKSRSTYTWHLPPNILPFIGLCREIYNETKILPFTLNNFHGSDSNVVSAIGAVKRLHRFQIHAVSSVHLTIGGPEAWGPSGFPMFDMSDMRLWVQNVLLNLIKLRKVILVVEGMVAEAEEKWDDVHDRVADLMGKTKELLNPGLEFEVSREKDLPVAGGSIASRA